MKVLGCAATRRRLQAYHDDELPVRRQIEVDAHLEWCDACASALEELQVLRVAVRASAPGRVPFGSDDLAGFQAAVVSRVGAEHTVALSTRVRVMFEDMHFVYAGMGAAAATVACLTIMLSMMNFAALTSPGFNQNPVVVDARMLMPRALDEGFYPPPSGSTDTKGDEDAAFTVSGVVTREGRVVNLELYPESGQAPVVGSSQARAVETMLGAMSQARFAPARVAGLPIAVNMVWLMERTTVRGTKEPDAPVIVPAARKRRVDVTISASPRRPVVA